MKKELIGYVLFVIVTLIALIILFRSSPLGQEEAYHNFSDNRLIFGIPNFWDVTSNIGFLFAGLCGLYKVSHFTGRKIQYQVFFLGILFVSIGSAYYHFNPNNDTLVWDRLPMTIGFMALISILISEFFSKKIGQKMLIPLLLIGILSVVYWVVYNDLRFYLLVQFYPIAVIPVVLIFFNSGYNLTIGYWILLLAYILAKIFEIYDSQIYDNLNFISGHSLKHLFAALGIFALLYTYIKRKEITYNS